MGMLRHPGAAFWLPGYDLDPSYVHLSSDHDIDHRQLTPRAFDSYSASLNALSYIRIRHALILEDLCLCEV